MLTYRDCLSRPTDSQDQPHYNQNPGKCSLFARGTKYGEKWWICYSDNIIDNLLLSFSLFTFNPDRVGKKQKLWISLLKLGKWILSLLDSIIVNVSGKIVNWKMQVDFSIWEADRWHLPLIILQQGLFYHLQFYNIYVRIWNSFFIRIYCCSKAT